MSKYGKQITELKESVDWIMYTLYGNELTVDQYNELYNDVTELVNKWENILKGGEN